VYLGEDVIKGLLLVGALALELLLSRSLILRIHNRNSDLISRGTNGYNFVKKHLDKNKQIELYMKLFRN
jgi:hypothetical protein